MGGGGFARDAFGNMRHAGEEHWVRQRSLCESPLRGGDFAQRTSYTFREIVAVVELVAVRRI